MRDLRKVREESQLKLTHTQLFALVGLAAVSLVLAGLLGYYFGRGATAAEQAAASAAQAPLIPEEVETESISTLLALAREQRRDPNERITLDYAELLPQSDPALPQMLRKPAVPDVAAEPPAPREVAPDALVESEDGAPPEPPRAGEAEAAPVVVPPSPEQRPSGKFTIQVSSFQESGQAQGLVDELKAKGFEAFTISADVNGRTWYRVRVGQFGSRDDASAELGRLTLMRSDLRPMVTFQ